LFVDGGQAGAFAFDLDIANANLSITVSPASLTAGFSSTVLDHGAHGEHMSAFGFFDYAIAGDASHTHGGSTPIGQALTLMVVNTAGAISANDFEEDSTGGIDSYFAADIMNTASAGLGAGTTGIVATFGGTTTSATPEPTTFMLLGAGLVAVAFLRRKRVSKT
jgi:hypothetical protein